jgi:hypothetical protein
VRAAVSSPKSVRLHLPSSRLAPSSPRKRKPALPTWIKDHALFKADPTSAKRVNEAIYDSLNPGTRATYGTAVARYIEWTSARRLPPFPADPVVLSGWVLDLSLFIAVSSVSKYLSGVRRHQLDVTIYEWNLQGNHVLASVLRFCKKRWPEKGRRNKTPITVLILCLFRAKLNLNGSHDDRMFFAASTVGTAGLLRGGEFLLSPSTTLEQRLLVSDFIFDSSGSRVDVNISASKTKFWRNDIRVLLYATGTDSCPLRAILDYMSASVVPLPENDFMFKRADGSPLTKAWMFKRTKALLASLDLAGSDKVFAASWRAGGAISAKWAGIYPDVVLAMGRWKSAAALSYWMTANADIKGAADKIGALTVESVTSAGFSPFLLGEYTAGRVFHDPVC